MTPKELKELQAILDYVLQTYSPPIVAKMPDFSITATREDGEVKVAFEFSDALREYRCASFMDFANHAGGKYEFWRGDCHAVVEFDALPVRPRATEDENAWRYWLYRVAQAITFRINKVRDAIDRENFYLHIVVEKTPAGWTQDLTPA